MSLVYIFTGEGKGKTSAALGMTLRAACDGKKVAWVAWYKTASWGVSEFKMEKYLKNVELHVFGKGFYFEKDEGTQKIGEVRVAKTKVGTVVDKTNAGEHRVAALSALKKAREILTEGNVDILICDELCQAVAQELVTLTEAKLLIESRGSVHLVLTGRDCPQELIDIADTVTEMKKIKHAYDKGITALKGLDF